MCIDGNPCEISRTSASKLSSLGPGMLLTSLIIWHTPSLCTCSLYYYKSAWVNKAAVFGCIDCCYLHACMCNFGPACMRLLQSPPRHQHFSAFDLLLVVYYDAVCMLCSHVQWTQLGQAWVTVVKRHPPQSMYLCTVRHSVNTCSYVPPHSNSLDSFNLQCVINSINATTFKLRMLQFCMCNACMMTADSWHDTAQVIVHWVSQLQLPWAKQHVSNNNSCTVLLDNWF